MMISLLRRLRHEDDGYALVIAVLLLSVMMVLLVVSLVAGNSALRNATDGMRWQKTLTVAEAGVNDAITRLGASRTAANPCDLAGTTVCATEGGEYQVSWQTISGGSIVITSRGYYPTRTAPKYTREVQVTYEPVPTFKYALFAQDALTIKNNPIITGDVYSTNGITVDNNIVICGSLTSANGSITLGQNDQVLKSYAATGCTGQSGNVWSGGSTGITGAAGVVIAGSAKASNPSSVTSSCKPSYTSYQISGGGTIQGNSTACGKVTGVTTSGTTTQGTSTAQPAVQTMPQFIFDPDNYTSLTCYPTGGTCGSNTSGSSVSDFNAYVAAHKTDLSGTFAIWQDNPTSSTKINLDGVTSIAGDVTIITNAPIDFGNTNTISTTAPSANFVAVSQYIPPSGTTCDVNGGDCSIYGQNQITFDRGVTTDPNDGVVGLLYTPGKMAFKNKTTAGEGALYANSMDMKNGFNIIYNPRVEQVLGFGGAFQQVLWKEINV